VTIDRSLTGSARIQLFRNGVNVGVDVDTATDDVQFSTSRSTSARAATGISR
jgi:hypothetical protein